ncbi:MAG: Nif3-like dinuclear metal center hexameric protein [Bacilli bacterium]
MIIKDVMNYLENLYPAHLAIDFDQERIGLIIGDENLELKNILFALDLTLEVLQEAIEKKANLVITHHPFFFKPLFQVLFSTNEGKIIKLMLEHQISLFVMHTNLDVGKGGVNDVLAKLIGIENVQVINDEPSKGNFLRYGNIPPLSLESLAKKVEKQFKITGVRVIGDRKRVISRVGVVGGSGAHDEDIDAALSVGLDCYITGEVKLPAAQKVYNQGLALIEVNHGVEKLVFETLSIKMETDLALKNRVLVTKTNTDPLYFLR